MKRKHLFLAIVALLAVSGLWLARSARRTPVVQNSNMDVIVDTPQSNDTDPRIAGSLPSASQTGPAAGPTNRPNPGRMLRPPNPTRRFTEFTPEQRVQFARQGHGPGG